MSISPALARTALILATVFPAAPVLAQGVGQGIYDLSHYSEQSRFGAWQVLCTAEGETSRPDQSRDCLLEEDSGFVIFTYPTGYFTLGLRDAAPGDLVFGRSLSEETNGVLQTYFGPGFTEEGLDEMGVARDGAAVTLDATGYAEAEAEALRLMRPDTEDE